MRGRTVWSLAVGLALIAAPTLDVAAQETGTVTGQVAAQGTGQALSNAQVFIEDLNVGGLTRSNGRYLLTSVPVGAQRLTVTLVGYGTQSQQITVRAGEVTEVNFEVQTVALNLDEIVVTGTGAPTQRRRLGQSISTVTSEELAMAPIASVADALVGRLPGARGLMSGGQTGAGSAIVLRGTSSISQRQSPIIYVDGVRIDNRPEGAESVQTDRLQDINPQDIERVEIIKGAAAATLYGTEASSGVIQIFTKRGQSGPPVYSFSTDLQYLEFPRRFEDNCGYDAAANDVVCNYPYDEFTQFAYQQNYNLSLRGGSPNMRYYVSGRILEEVNPSPNNELNNQSIRAAFDFTHTDRLTSSVDLSIVNRDLQTASPGWGDVFGNLMLANPLVSTPDNPYGAYAPTKGTEVTENFQESLNTLLNGRVSYDWTDNLRSTVQVGYNFIDSRFSHFYPQGVVAEDVTGEKNVTDRRYSTTTLEFNTYWERQLTDRLMGNVTVGAQSFREVLSTDDASVREFGSPTLKTLSGGAEITGVSEGYSEVVNAGLFFQGQIGLDDRLFVTGGVRFDGNSAFGEEFGLQAYPKAGLSWVVSEYDFWSIDWIDDLRLRAAIGSSGLQPGAFDAQRTWEPNSSVIGGYVTPENLGNPELKPERSTEIEFALETGMFGGRFGAEVTYFNQTTNDALLPVPPSPGTGFTGTQLRNLGTLKSWGVEITTNTRIIESPGLNWDVSVSPTFLDQWVEDMGGIPDFRLGSRRRFQSLYEGYWPGIWIAPVVDPDQPYVLSGPIESITSRSDISPNLLKAADGSDSLAVIGRPQPNFTIDLGSTLQFGDFTFSNVFEGATGFIVSNETNHLRLASGYNRLDAELDYALANPTSAAERQPLVDEYGRKHPSVISNTIFDGDYLRWAEATLAWRMPEAWAQRFGSSGTTISFGVRNVHVFSDYFSDFKGGWIDPGTRGLEAGDAFTQNVDYLKTPPPRRFVLSIRAQF